MCVWRAPLEVKPFGKSLVSHCFGLSREREMLGSLRSSGGRQRHCGINFTSIPFFEPLVLMLLKVFLLMLFSTIDIWRVNQNGLFSNERSLVQV